MADKNSAAITAIDLPSPPVIAVQILNAVKQEDSGTKDLVRIVSADPALTAKMLQIANSGFYAASKEISSIERALSLLGTNLIKNIALSFVIADELRETDSSEFDFDRYWRLSVTAAVAAELLSHQIGAQNDDIFVTALLQNIGMLALFWNNREAYSQLLKIDQNDPRPLPELEREYLGLDHLQVGLQLIEAWGLPVAMAQPIFYHHRPEEAPQEHRQTARILYFAMHLAAIYTEDNAAEQARMLQSELNEHYQLSSEESRDFIDRSACKAIEILQTFEINPGDLKPYSEMLQEANEALGQLNLSYEQLVIELKDAKDKSERLAQELSDANLRLTDLVYIDGLTGLHNHRFFQETLAKEIARAQRYHFNVSLILFDIDHFKQVNDNYGHPAGDLVLVNIARAMRKTVRPSDVVARYGGEEFAVILPETNMSGAKVFASRLRRTIEGVLTPTGSQQISVTISAGVTTFNPQQKTTKDQLIDTADRGLYLSKQNGRNQVTLLETETGP